MLRSTASVLLMAMLPMGAFAALGDLDTTFGNGAGYVTTASGEAMIRMADGRLVVAGTTGLGIRVFRLGVSGVLDKTFDKDGIAITPVGTSNAMVNSVIEDADGKLVVVGTINILEPDCVKFCSDEDEVFLVRYNSDGTLDTTFDTDGVLVTAIDANTNETGQDVVQLPSGGLMVGGAKGSNFMLLCLNSDGSIDTSFDGDGIVTTAGGVGMAMVRQADEKLVVAGYATATPDFMVVRYNPDGSLDTSFSTDGQVVTSIGTSYDYPYAILVQQDDKIVVAGSAHDGIDSDFALVRYNTNGSLDTTFDTDGMVTTDFQVTDISNDAAWNLVQQPDGLLLASGTGATNYAPSFVAMARYNDNGSLDTGFGTGKAMSTVDGGAWAAVHQPDGKLVIAGNVISRFETGQVDSDGDGYVEQLDNCSADANPDQLNTDGDAWGDACDDDDDGDGYLDMNDAFPLDAGALTGINGAAASENLGRSVGYVGDINNDGFGDFIVGAPLADVLIGETLVKDAGAAYTVSGATGLIIQEFHGDGAKDMFGFAVAGVGDVNGDGTPDVAIGAPFADDEGSSTKVDAGFVSICSGNNWYCLRNYWGAQSGQRFGYSVAGGANFDTDVDDDVVIGSPFADKDNGDGTFTVDAGRVDVYTDVTNFSNFDPYRTYHGAVTKAQFGAAVAMAGDIDSDGYADIVVGAPLDDRDNGDGTITADTGSATVLSPFLNAVISDPVYGVMPKNAFGATVSAAGDVNDDGVDDFMVGAWKDDPVVDDVVRKDAGAVYVYSGSDFTTILRTLKGKTGKEGFGYALASVGDLDSDGYDDVAIGTYGHDDAPATKVLKDVGKMAVYSGADGSTELLSAKGHAAGDWFGAALAVGDTNKDGIDDIIVGVPKDDVLPDGSTKALKDAGSAVVISGGVF